MKNLVYDIINPSNNILLDPSQRLEAGDRILYVSSNESVRLIADHETSYESCNGCYFDNEIPCSISNVLKCYDYDIIFKLDDSFTKSSAIRKSICNEDICPYYKDECNKYEESDDLCLLRRIIMHEKNEI